MMVAEKKNLRVGGWPANNTEKKKFFFLKKNGYFWWVDGGMMVYGRGGKAIFGGLMVDG